MQEKISIYKFQDHSPLIFFYQKCSKISIEALEDSEKWSDLQELLFLISLHALKQSELKQLSKALELLPPEKFTYHSDDLFFFVLTINIICSIKYVSYQKIRRAWPTSPVGDEFMALVKHLQAH